jgi:hypothetical protein
VRGIAAFARNQAWMVGTSAMERWNGKTWATVPGSHTRLGGGVYWAIGGRSVTDVRAATSGTFLHYAC